MRSFFPIYKVHKLVGGGKAIWTFVQCIMPCVYNYTRGLATANRFMNFLIYRENVNFLRWVGRVLRLKHRFVTPIKIIYYT